MSSIRVPNSYTPCELYQGAIIAIQNGTYCAFDRGGKMPRVSGDTRAACRRAIDEVRA